MTYIWIAGLPGRIALARKHPEAEAVKIMGWAGLLPTILPWIQAFIWAFKPTDIVDIRRFPKEEAKALDEERVAEAKPSAADRATARRSSARDAWRRRDRPHGGTKGYGAPPMLLGFVLLFAYGFIVWLVFFKFRWLKFTIAWGFFSTFFVLHLGIIFLIGLRYVAPTSTEARVIQRTIQLTPRLSGADAGHGGAGRAECPRQARHAAVPVRSAHLRGQGASSSRRSSPRRSRTC